MIKRKIFLIASLLVVISISTSTASTKYLNEPKSIYAGQAQIDWLINQQNLHLTGLLESYEGDEDTKAFIFDQALAIIAFTHANELTKAKSILDIMELLQNKDTHNVWIECYYADDPNIYAGCYKHVTGPIAWMVIAINYYEEKTGDSSYAPTARKALNWLDTMQHVIPGEERYGAFGWSDYDRNIISTEQNLDVYSAYYWRGVLDSNDIYLNRASDVQDFLQREMWAPSPESNHWHNVNIFWRGLEPDCNFCTDPQSWGVLALGPIGPSGEPFYKSLCWLLDLDDSTRNIQDYDENITSVDGFKGCTGEEDYIEVDFTEHVAAAFYSIGDDLKGDYFHGQMERLVNDNGGLVHSFCGRDPNLYNRHNYVASVAWHYFNEVKINPFKLSSAQNWPRAANIDKEGKVDLLDFQSISSGWLNAGPDLVADLDGDGVVDLYDFAVMAQYWLCGCDE